MAVMFCVGGRRVTAQAAARENSCGRILGGRDLRPRSRDITANKGIYLKFADNNFFCVCLCMKTSSGQCMCTCFPECGPTKVGGCLSLRVNGSGLSLRVFCLTPPHPTPHPHITQRYFPLCRDTEHIKWASVHILRYFLSNVVSILQPKRTVLTFSRDLV